MKQERSKFWTLYDMVVAGTFVYYVFTNNYTMANLFLGVMILREVRELKKALVKNGTDTTETKS